MTLEELLAADDKTKNEFSNRVYKTLVSLYLDQYSEGHYKVEIASEDTN